MNVLLDWLGDGLTPVENSLAVSRSLVCMEGYNGKPCPFNKAPLWWERMIKDPIAAVIRKQMRVKTKMIISVPREDELRMCSECGCALPLKVHVPIKHVKEHTPKEAVDKMPSFCWQKKEIETYAI